VDGQDAFDRVERDHVAILKEGDRTSYRSFRTDMADAEATSGARKTAVGDERNLVAHSLAIESCSGLKHLAHPRPASRAFIPDDEYIAFLVLLVCDRIKAIFLAVETTRRSAEFQVLHAGDLHDRAIGREVAAQADNATGSRYR